MNLRVSKINTVSRIVAILLAFILVFSNISPMVSASSTVLSSVGKNESTSSMAPKTYVIGTHRFTEGMVLTTARIMLAARTIDEDGILDAQPSRGLVDVY